MFSIFQPFWNLPKYQGFHGTWFYNLDLCLSDKNIQAQFVFKLNDENFHIIEVLVEAHLWFWKLISYVKSKMINLISVKRSRPVLNIIKWNKKWRERIILRNLFSWLYLKIQFTYIRLQSLPSDLCILENLLTHQIILYNPLRRPQSLQDTKDK